MSNTVSQELAVKITLCPEEKYTYNISVIVNHVSHTHAYTHTHARTHVLYSLPPVPLKIIRLTNNR